MSFKKSFLRNVARFGGYTYLVQFIEFASTIILSRIISPEEYGFVALITVFSGFVFVFTNVGIMHAIIRNDYDNDKLGRFFSLTIWIGLFLFTLFTLLAYPIALFYENMNLFFPSIVIGFGFITQAINFVPNAIASKALKFNTIGEARVLQTVFQVIFMIILAFLNLSYWSLIIPITFSPLIQYLYYYYKMSFNRKYYRFKDAWHLLKEIRSLVGSITISGIINYWTGNTDNLVIGKVYGDAALGLYNRAYRFIFLAKRLINSIFGIVLFPSLKKLKDDGGDVNKEFLSILGIISIVNFPLGILLILFADPLVLILWGKDWIGVSPFLPYIGILILVQTVLMATRDFYVLQNEEKTVLKITVINSIVSIAGILTGAFFSPLHIILFFTIANTLMIPVQVIIGFYKALNYKSRELYIFWGPKFLVSALFIYLIYFDYYIYQVILTLIYFIHLFINQKQELLKFVTLFRNWLKRTNLYYK